MRNNEKPAQITPPPYLQVTFWQLVLVFFVIIAAFLWQKDFVTEILYGALIFIVPNTYFAWQAFRFNGAAKAKKTTQSMYKGQAGKFVLTLVMFAMVFGLSRPQYPWIVLASYSVNIIVHLLLAPVIFRQSKIYS